MLEDKVTAPPARRWHRSWRWSWRQVAKWLGWGLAGLFLAFFVLMTYLRQAGSGPIVLADGPGGLRIAEGIIATAPRTLIVAAHPDDIEWYMGGTVARLVDAGAEITIVMATNGEARSGRELSGAALGKVRQAEQIEAARRLGVGATGVVFLELPDAGLWRSPRLTARVREVWEQVQPELVFSFDASRPRLPYVHPDHQSVGLAVGRIAREPLGAGTEIWLFHSREPDIVVDITETLTRKVHSLAAHRSQNGGDEARMLRSHTSSSGAIGGQAGVQFGEAFRRLPARLP